MMDTKKEAVILDGERLDYVNDNISLIQNPEFFCFGTDALLLASFVDRKKRKAAAELGAGGGIISLLCAARGRFDKIHAIEVQSYFADLCERNASLNGFSQTITTHNMNVKDICAADVGGEVDAVISNPPYMRSDSGKRNEHIETEIARHEVEADIDDFVCCAARLLKFGGCFYSVYRPDRLIDYVYAMRKSRLEPKRMTFVQSDMDAPPSLVLIKAKLGASVGLKITKPLILYSGKVADGKREYSDAMKFILDNGYMPGQ